ncbi:MAG: hypothetical protein OEZ39_16965 [Gammaproteobacteria bacterium]|nr:hypothetical protein [Gammaproteobacteria bacterium]MDH5653553.1 hypothetical protein [Gammaproteobacteria bacterium]
MKIGILEADRLAPEITATYGSYGQMSARLLSGVESDLTYIYWQARAGECPTDPAECDAWLLTGSKADAWANEPWILQLMDFIQRVDQARAKLIGICFGHQLIARALGGTVGKSDKGWGIGVMPTQIITPQAWMQPPVSAFSLLYSHQDQVMTLPPRAVPIAGHDFCPHSSFQVGEHILTLQGHPEFSKAYARLLINNRRDIIGAQRCTEAEQSMRLETDHEVIAQWLVGFYRT